MPAPAHSDPSSPPVIGHVVPFRILLAVLGMLLFLTIMTVAATLLDLGSLNLWVALSIALVKATLVALYFMHLRYDRPFFAFVFFLAFLFVILFIGLALMDAIEYQPEMIPGYAPAATG